MPKPDPLDGLMRRQKDWERGLPWSRFGVPLVGAAVLLALWGLWQDRVSVPLLAGVIVLAAAGAVFLVLAKRRRDGRSR